MALRSPALWMGNPAVQHTAQNDRLMLAGLHRPETGQTATNRPLTAAGGVVSGPDGTMGEVTLLSNTQFTVNPARWVVPSSASALHGVYKVQNDAVSTLGITAQNATQFRRSYFGVWVIDSFVAGSGDDLPHWGLVDGALAASAVAATLPSGGTLPANFLALGEFLIPPVGQAVTYTPYDLRTGLRGGILPVTATDTRAGAYVDQYRSHPTIGLQRWNGTRWVAARDLPVFATLAARDAFYAAPNLPVGGTQCVCLGTVMTHDGTAWRFILAFGGQIGTDINGIAFVPHGGGQTPRKFVVGSAGSSTDGQTVITKAMEFGADATNITLRFARTDNSTYFNNPGLGYDALVYF